MHDRRADRTLTLTIMINITSINFEAELVNASLAQPVLLDIWAPWCGPCRTLGPVLEKLETDYGGRFKLGKLNADEEPEIAQQLSQMFGVRSIPFCVLFKAGQPADGFVGALAEAEVRKFLDKHVAEAPEQAPGDPALDAEHLLADGDVEGGLARLAAALESRPSDDTARYDYLRALLEAEHLDDARLVWAPVANHPAPDPRLAAVGHWLCAKEAHPTARPRADLDAALVADKRDFATRFESAQLHFAEGAFTRALDELLEILIRNKSWSDDLARKTYVAILQIMAKPDSPARTEDASRKGTLELTGKSAVPSSDPVIDAYRRKLSMALF